MDNVSIYCRIINALMLLLVTMEIKNKFTPEPKIKLMDQTQQILRYHHYSINTEKTCCEQNNLVWEPKQRAHSQPNVRLGGLAAGL